MSAVSKTTASAAAHFLIVRIRRSIATEHGPIAMAEEVKTPEAAAVMPKESWI
jgi:hypothetical protein